MTINVAKPKTQYRSQDKKSAKEKYPLPMPPNPMLEYFLGKGLIKRIQGK